MKKNISLILSLLFTVFLLYILFQNISLEKIGQALLSVPLASVLLASFFHFLAYFFRTQTLFLFLKNTKLKFTYLLAIHFIHNFYVHIIPASLGELSFPLLLKNRVRMEKSLSVLIISRILLMLLTVFMFLISLFYVFDITEYLSFNILYLLFLFISLVFLFFMWKFRLKLVRVIQKISILKQVLEKLEKLYFSTKEELEKLKEPKFLAKILLNSLINIFATIGFYVIVLRAEGIHLHLLEVVFISAIGVAFLILPIKSVGGFGTVEGSWTIGLILLGVNKEKAIESGFVIHILALINSGVLCIIGMIIKRLPIFNIREIPK